MAFIHVSSFVEEKSSFMKIGHMFLLNVDFSFALDRQADGQTDRCVCLHYVAYLS